MPATPEDAARISRLLTSQKYAVLSTLDQDGRPYAHLMAFDADPHLGWLVFCTLRATRKHANITADPRVALLVDDRANAEADLNQAAAVSILGTCATAQGRERTELRRAFLAKHPALKEFVDSPDCAVIKVDVTAYSLVTSFQNVTELRP